MFWNCLVAQLVKNLPAIVEDARDILDMFALMSGTQEFASYGSVEQIKRYFAFGKNKNMP